MTNAPNAATASPPATYAARRSHRLSPAIEPTITRATAAQRAVGPAMHGKAMSTTLAPGFGRRDDTTRADEAANPKAVQARRHHNIARTRQPPLFSATPN